MFEKNDKTPCEEWIAGQIAAGAVALAAGFFVFRVAAMRVPYGLFFGATAALLYGMAVVFADQGIVEPRAGLAVDAPPPGPGRRDFFFHWIEVPS